MEPGSGMDLWLVAGVLLFILGTGVAILVLNIITRRSVTHTWRNWALARGWEFHPSWPEILRRFSGGAIASRKGRARLGYEGVVEGRPVAGFEWSYVTYRYRTRTVIPFHVCLVRVPGIAFPELSVAPEKLHKRVLGEDIQFEDAAFNQTWWVKGASPRFAHDVVNPRVMQWLNSGGLPPGSVFWFEGDAILLCTPGASSPADIDERLGQLMHLRDSLPPFVLKGLQGDGRSGIDDASPSS